MNEMISVPMNGSWVTRIMNIRAGSNGALRAQSPARCSEVSLPPAGAGAWAPAPAGRSTEVLIWHSFPDGPLLLVLRRDRRFRHLLPLVQSLVDGDLPGDRGADVLGHLGAEVGELGDPDELDARGRPRLHARV